MPQNVLFRLNRGNKKPFNSKIIFKNCETKMQLKLHVVKISCVKILDKLALAFEYEILNTTETSCEKIIASLTLFN